MNANGENIEEFNTQKERKFKQNFVKTIGLAPRILNLQKFSDIKIAVARMIA